VTSDEELEELKQHTTANLESYSRTRRALFNGASQKAIPRSYPTRSRWSPSFKASWAEGTCSMANKKPRRKGGRTISQILRTGAHV